MKFLNYYSKINEAFIHPKGETASNFLLNELSLEEGDVVLEVGFGTGSTLVKTIALKKGIILYGLEKSALMLKKAKSRLRFCGIEKRVSLKLLNETNTIPFESNFFDKIYIESVLAIQEGESLKTMISELSRVLKPKGLLCINELLWSPNTKQDKIDAVNKYVKEKFGLIQANGNYRYINEWLDLLKNHDFEIKKSEDINALKNQGIFKNSFYEICSSFFSIRGKIRKKINSKLRKEWNSYEKAMKLLNKDYKLDPYIIVASSKKTE